jgi:hypothetical protein
MCPTEQGATRAQAAVAFPLSTERGFTMSENDFAVAPAGRKQKEEVVSQPSIANATDEGDSAPEDAEESRAQADTWGLQNMNDWRKTFNQENKPANAFVEQISPAQNLLASQQAEDAAKEFRSLDKMQTRFMFSDDNDDGKLSRMELQKEINEMSSVSPNFSDPEKLTLQNFTKVSGGTNGISRADLERAAMVSLTTALEASARSGKLGIEERSAITQWAGTLYNKDDVKKAQDKLNNALEGTGLQAKLELSTFKNYLGKDVPITNFTLTKDNKEVDKFAYMSGWDAYRSLLGGKSVEGKEILDNVDPSKTFSPEMTKQLQEVRDLETLLRSTEVKDGAINLKEAAKEQIGEDAAHASEFLQKNFARLAMIDGDGSSISKSELSDAMIESLAALTKSSIDRDGLRTSELVEGMLRDALDPAIVSNSQKFVDTINAALEQKGYKATLTRLMNESGSRETRTLTLFNKNNPNEKQSIGRMLEHGDWRSRINDYRYDGRYDGRYDLRPDGRSRYDRAREESYKQPNDPRGGQAPYYDPRR